VRVCLVYDCLYPYTVGGAERWLRTLGAELARDGHEVTYVTRRQWDDDDEPSIEGVRVVAVAPGGPLYTDGGRRRAWPPLRFGLGVFLHLLRNRRRYDTVHSIAFPYFSLLAVRAAAPRIELWVDWFEVWTPAYWREYLGRVGGRIGHAVQRMCVRLTRRAFVFSDLHARRLREEGLRGEPIRLSGLYDGTPDVRLEPGAPRDPMVLFAGRHIREKRAHVLPAAVARARAEVPGLRARILGDGPERPHVLRAIADAGAGDFVDAPGFVSSEEVHDAFATASCHVLPSSREGYGMVVIEAAAAGTPSVVVAEPDNAAAELIEDGVNGFVAASVDDLPRAIARVHAEGPALRERTAQWFERNAKALSAAESARLIAAQYERAAAAPRAPAPPASRAPSAPS
jgi:glycosyltransferase involved in cell wall biosynthesis